MVQHIDGCQGEQQGWANAWGDTCMDYARRGLCAGGRLLNTSMGGALNGSPEHACCECGASTNTAALSGHITELIFVATHHVGLDDARLMQHYAEDLKRLSHARLWLLLLQANKTPRPDAKQAAEFLALGVDVCLWSNKNAFATFPRLQNAIRKSPGLALEDTAYMRQYYWFHTSLIVWMRRHGHAYPNARYFWRMEPDVLYAGSGLATMLDIAARTPVDLLLPKYQTQAETGPGYHHFARNRKLWLGVPPSKRVWSLVSIGRYSIRFLRVMQAIWEAGILGYEEILLPMACTATGRCSTARSNGIIASHRIHLYTSHHIPSHPVASHYSVSLFNLTIPPPPPSCTPPQFLGRAPGHVEVCVSARMDVRGVSAGADEAVKPGLASCKEPILHRCQFRSCISDDELAKCARPVASSTTTVATATAGSASFIPTFASAAAAAATTTSTAAARGTGTQDAPAASWFRPAASISYTADTKPV